LGKVCHYNEKIASFEKKLAGELAGIVLLSLSLKLYPAIRG